MKIIKKYQNRRMYDITEKKYITLNSLQQLIYKDQDLKIMDVKTSEDITKQVLIQTILELNLLGLEKFSNENLTNLIKILSGERKDSYNIFLQESTDHFTKIEENKKVTQSNDERLSANKLTKFWQSITGAKNE